MNLQILHKNDLPLGGFAGLKEHRLIMDNKVGGGDQTWDGLGQFVYLADAQFLPKGETRLHSHQEIDVISIMVDGRVEHEGSLDHGQSIHVNQVQVQRAGGEGFKHNEINPDNKKNRMLQLWVLPETKGEPADYKFYDLERGTLNMIYGGERNQNNTLDSHTIIKAGVLDKGQTISCNGEFMLYLTRGSAELNDENIKDGDLVRGNNLNFRATMDNVLVFVVTIENFKFNKEK